MILKNIRLENFRLIKDFSLQLGRRVTLFTGVNGSGKTAVLDGISIGLGAILTHLPEVSGVTFKNRGDIRQFDNLVEPYSRITLQTTDGLKWDRMKRRDKSISTTKRLPENSSGIRDLERFLDAEIIDPMNNGRQFQLPVFISYGVSRALLEAPHSRKGFPKTHQRLEALHGALEAVSRFKSAFIWFYNKENEEQRLQRSAKSFEVTLRELDTVRRALSSIFPDLSDPHIELNPLRFLIRQDSESFDILQLSDGYKTLLGLVIDMSARMAMANPHLDDPLAAEAIVMIDELDLHLHPSWQQRVIGDLLRTFVNTQFIFTTHSPYIVESTNNSLKRFRIREMLTDDKDIQLLTPLDPDDTKAYLLRGKDEFESLMNDELGLLDDRLIEPFNQITALYDRMRDIEWEAK